MTGLKPLPATLLNTQRQKCRRGKQMNMTVLQIGQHCKCLVSQSSGKEQCNTSKEGG